MSTQRVIVAKFIGDAVLELRKQFTAWPACDSRREEAQCVCVEADELVERLWTTASSPPVVYFSEWIDMWSMADVLPGLRNSDAQVVCGARFQICLHRVPVAVAGHLIGQPLTQE